MSAFEVQPEPVREQAPFAPVAVPEAVMTLPRPVRPNLQSVPARAALLTMLVGAIGVAAGVAGVLLGISNDVIGLAAMVALVGGGRALAPNIDEGGISIPVVGALAGAALFGARAAIVLAIAAVAADWSARRPKIRQLVFDTGVITLASLAAAAVFSVVGGRPLRIACAGVLAGVVYFMVDAALHSLAAAAEDEQSSLRRAFRERCASLLPHYLAYGLVAGAIAIAYYAVGLYALAVFAVPVLLMRKTQQAYLAYAQRSARDLRAAAEAIQAQNVSLEEANRLLKERSTEAIASLSASVDARDSYTTGHSRRVQQIALAIGRRLGLSQAELDVLGHAALFHDIGKLAIPDAILLKPASLTTEEWDLMQRHADEGARIIDRLGFLNDAVPAIRHHHERWDGTGYPDRLAGEDIPLGARIIHVADALDSMLTTRIYRAARPAAQALDELRRASGSQFCPRCVAALERILPLEGVDEQGRPQRVLAAS